MEENVKNYEDDYVEEYLEDIEYVQAETIKDLEKKVRNRIEKEYGVIENNPFLDTTVTPNMWTQVVLYYNDEEEENQ